MFLLGMAPLGLGCGDGKAEDDDDGTGTDTGETGSTGPTGTGTTVGGTATTTTGSPTDDDGGTTTDGDGELCDDYADAYADCYGSYYGNYVLESCEYTRGYILQYYSAECLSAWEATIACMTAADCNQRYEQCQIEFIAQNQACSYYYSAAYYTCYLIGEFVGGCVNPNISDDAMLDCVQTHENLYNMYGGVCGDAFVSMMACISQLDCLALSDKAYVYASCGPQIDAKNAACQ